jgi:hypothetical protein
MDISIRRKHTMKLMERLRTMETRPINWVFQIKLSRMPIPIELGFTTEAEARAAREEFECAEKNNIVRWTDLKELSGFEYPANRTRQTEIEDVRDLQIVEAANDK